MLEGSIVSSPSFNARTLEPSFDAMHKRSSNTRAMLPLMIVSVETNIVIE
jgi:hypothetical protein